MQNTTGGEMDNATIVWISKGNPALIARALFLLGITLFGFTSNLLLLIAIIRSRTFRTLTFNLVILNVAFANLLQCATLAPYAITTSIREVWVFGTTMCGIISFLLTCLLLVKILTWLVIALERFFAIRSCGTRNVTFTHARLAVVAAVSWVYCVAFCAPILFGVIPSEINTTKYLCSFDASGTIVYTSILCLFCVFIPVIVTAVLFAVVWKYGINERRKVRDMRKCEKVGSNHDKFGSIFMLNDAPIKKEMSFTRHSVVLFVLWLVFEAPLIVLLFVQQFHAAVDKHYRDVQWYIKFPSVLDTVFTWMMFSYTAIFPVVFLSFMKDIQQRLKQQIMCRQNNSVTDLRVIGSASKTDAKNADNQLTSASTVGSLKIPVLFATSQGIQLKTYRHDGESVTTSLEATEQSNDNGARKCDVLGSHEFVRYDDTSDYDSNDDVDPYSVSHPITSKSDLASQPALTHKRSISDPEVCKITGRKSKSNLPNTSCLKRTQRMDSGIDVRQSNDSIFTVTPTGTKISRSSQDTSDTTVSGISSNRPTPTFVNQLNITSPATSAGQRKRVLARKNGLADNMSTPICQDVVKCDTNAGIEADNRIVVVHEPRRSEPVAVMNRVKPDPTAREGTQGTSFLREEPDILPGT